MLYNALSIGNKSQNCPFRLGFCHPTGGVESYADRQRAQKIGKDRVCDLGDMLAYRQTDTHTDVLITIPLLRAK